MRVTYPLRLTVACVFAITALRVWFLGASDITLFADEAQYWVWSRHLDFGYYSKPPMIAWVIAATTALFGHEPFGVRLAGPLLHAGAALLLYGVGTRLFSARVGMWSALTYLLLPGVTVSSFMIATDAPFLFSWALALYALVRTVESNKWRWWVLVGVATGGGMLSKYTMVMFALGALVFLLKTPEKLQTPKPWVAALIAALIYAPNLIWNIENGFVSYGHTADNSQLLQSETTDTTAPLPPMVFSHCTPQSTEMEEVAPAASFGKKLEFLGAQFGVFGPLLFATLLWLLIAKRRMLLAHEKSRLLFWQIVPLMAVIVPLSLITRAHANWMAPVYVAASVLVSAWLVEKNNRWVLRASAALGLLVAVAYGNYDALRAHLPAAWDPFLRMRGWEELASAVQAEQQKHPNLAILANERKLTAMLTYLLREGDAPGAVLKWPGAPIPRDYFDMQANVQNQAARDFLLISPAFTRNACDIATEFTRVKELQVWNQPLTARKRFAFGIDALWGWNKGMINDR